jgi:carbon monoxide dehydrogenase subunit G
VRPWLIACVIAVFAAAFVAMPGYAADDLVVEAERRGEAVEVRARATIAAPVPLVWRVLTDYEDLPRFIPGIAKSIVRQRDGNRLLVEHTGEARFLFFSFPIEVTLEVTESPVEWVTSRAVGGNVRRMNARYDLSADGASGTVVLRYYGLIEPDFALPPLIGVAAMRRTVEEQFTAMVGEIERRAATGTGK